MCGGEDDNELSEDPFHNHTAGNIFSVAGVADTSLTHS